MGGWVGRTTVMLGLALSAAAADAQQARSAATLDAARESVDALEAQLERAVDRVSLPHAGRLVGRVDAARGYRLPGYGLVLVLTPRALPGPSGRVYYLRRGAKPHVRHLDPHAAPPPAAAPEPPEAGRVESFERQVIVLQQEAEAARREAEQEMERIVHEVRVRVAPPAVPAPAVPAPPAPGDPPAPPQAEPPPPPWKFWFEAGDPKDGRTPDAVVADVRRSVIDALAARVPAPSGLQADERVTVAVDFVPGGLLAANARPNRTLVVSVRAKDVLARAKGSLSAEELARRIEVSEY